MSFDAQASPVHAPRRRTLLQMTGAAATADNRAIGRADQKRVIEFYGVKVIPVVARS
jgi:hypothetical protein